MAAGIYALVLDGSTVSERKMLDLATIPAHKKYLWRPVEEVGNDTFDPLTQKKTGPVTTIEATRVVDTYTVASLTAQEISDAKDAAVNSLNGSLYSALAKVLLNHENRIRALESKGPVTMAQFKGGVKALL